MDYKHPLTKQGNEYQASVLLELQFIVIFRSETVTATVKELVAYTGFYVRKAVKDAFSGLPSRLRNFNDSITEIRHKDARAITFIVVGEQVKGEGLTIKDEYSPNNLS